MKKLLIPIWLLTLILAACNPSTAELNNQGNNAFTNKDYDSALAAYQEAQAQSPEQAEPYYNAAGAHYRREDYPQAAQQLQQALPNAPDNLGENSFYNLGNALFNTQQFDAAAEAYREALRLNPDDTDAKHNLELALKHLQQQEQEQQKNQEQQDQQDQQDQQSQQDEQSQQGGRDQQDQQSQQDQQDQQDQQSQQGRQNQPDQKESQGDKQGNKSQTEPQDETQPPAQPQQAQGLTPEQARQLLTAAAKDTQNLQQYLQQVLATPGGPPDKDW
jgi:Ca-activated chloride channel family protein